MSFTHYQYFKKKALVAFFRWNMQNSHWKYKRKTNYYCTTNEVKVTDRGVQ